MSRITQSQIHIRNPKSRLRVHQLYILIQRSVSSQVLGKTSTCARERRGFSHGVSLDAGSNLLCERETRGISPDARAVANRKDIRPVLDLQPAELVNDRVHGPVARAHDANVLGVSQATLDDAEDCRGFSCPRWALYNLDIVLEAGNACCLLPKNMSNETQNACIWYV